MNQTFSPTRFARLNRWLWATKGQTYLYAGAALLIIVVLILSPALNTDNGFSNGIQRGNIIYFTIISLLLSGSIGSDVFSALFRQESAITYLMIPASRTEKFWLGVLYCILALLLLSMVFFGYEAIVFNIANSRLPVTEVKYEPSLIFHTSSITGDKDLPILLGYMLLLSLSVALLGSFFFRRGVFVRNVGVALLTVISFIFIYKWLVSWQFGEYEVGTSLPFLQTSVSLKGNYQNLTLPAWLSYGAYVGTLLMLWVIARVRFNEIER